MKIVFNFFVLYVIKMILKYIVKNNTIINFIDFIK